jgi:hypothetical protein
MVKRSTNLSVEGLVKHRVSQTGYCSVNLCQQGKKGLESLTDKKDTNHLNKKRYSQGRHS